MFYLALYSYDFSKMRFKPAKKFEIKRQQRITKFWIRPRDKRKLKTSRLAYPDSLDNGNHNKRLDSLSFHSFKELSNIFTVGLRHSRCVSK